MDSEQAQLLNSEYSLAWLIDPVSQAEFFAEYWERRTLVVRRNQPGYFARLLSLEEVDRALTTLDRKHPEIQLKNAARELTSDDYTTDGETLDVAKVYQLFGEGSTITLAFLENVIPSLASFCRSLEKEFTFPFQANIYLTPPGAQGAKPHYDTHDVFVLQVTGSKKWTIYGTPVEVPLPGQDFDAAVHQLGEKTMEFELKAGDVAYIPRGVGHDAHSTDEVSMHITAGVLRYTWTDLLLEYVASAALNDPEFRHALPAGFARSGFDRIQARATLRRLLERLPAKADFDATLDQFVDQFLGACPPLLEGQMAQMAEVDRLSSESVVGARPGAIARVQVNGDSVKVNTFGQTITLPAYVAEPLRFALEHERFAVRDLPGELDDAGKVTLVKRLVREGLVMAQSW